ncbi:MAG: hypothetical protein ACTH2Q_17070 [Propionibacteriaceae bacterium]
MTRSSDRSWIRRLLGLVSFVGERVLVDPVRAGRLRDNGWPPGLKGIVGIGLLLYALVMGLAVFGGQLRTVADLGYRSPDETFPMLALPAIVVAVVFTCSCLFTAALHLVWWLRPLVLLVVLAIVLKPLDLADPHWTNFVFLAAATGLVLLMALRWTKPFRWWEFLVTAALIGHAVVANVGFRAEMYVGFANDLRLNSLSLIMLVMWALAIPAALVAGAAMAELTISTVTWTMTGLVRIVVGRPTALVCLGLVVLAVGWRFVRSGWLLFGAAEPDPPRTFAVGVAMTFLLVGLCLVIARIPATTPGSEGSSTWSTWSAEDRVLPTWSRATLPMALLLAACMVGTSQVRQVLQVVGLGGLGDWLVNLGGGNQLWFLTALLGVSTLLWGVRLARRGRPDEGVVWGAFGGLLVLTTANTLIGIEAAVSGILTAVTLLVLGAGVVLVVRGDWRSRSVVGLAGLAVLAVAFEYREYIFEPVTALFALTGVGVGLLVGLLWRLLTDNGYSHGESARFPRASRVLLALANATMGVTAVAMVSLLGGHWELNLDLAEDAGDTLLGSTLLFVTVFGSLQAGLRRRPEPDQAVIPVRR